MAPVELLEEAVALLIIKSPEVVTLPKVVFPVTSNLPDASILESVVFPLTINFPDDSISTRVVSPVITSSSLTVNLSDVVTFPNIL